MKKILAGALLLFFAINVSGQKQAKEKVAWKTYTDAKEKVSVSYPATWEQKKVENALFFFMAPYDHAGQKYRENIHMIVAPAYDLYLVEYLADARKKLGENVPGFKELQSQYIKIDGLDCCRMIYEFKMKDLVLRDAYYLVLKDGKAYTLTCSALEGTFNKFFPVFEKIAASFKIK